MNGGNAKAYHLHPFFIELHQSLYDFLVVQKIIFLSDLVWCGPRLALDFIKGGQAVRCKDFINGFATIATKILIIKLHAAATALISTMITGRICHFTFALPDAKL